VRERLTPTAGVFESGFRLMVLGGLVILPLAVPTLPAVQIDWAGLPAA
jgi:hypothetical protein